MEEKKNPYPFFTKPGGIESAAEIDAVSHFAEAALFYLPQPIAQWPHGIRMAALGFMLEAMGEGVAPHSVEAVAKKKAKDAYLKMFGYGGGMAIFLAEDGSEGCWARDIRERAFSEPLPKILADYLKKTLPAPYAPKPWTGALSWYEPDPVSNYVQTQILSAALAVYVDQHGPLEVTIVDAKLMTDKSIDISVTDGRLQIRQKP